MTKWTPTHPEKQGTWATSHSSLVTFAISLALTTSLLTLYFACLLAYYCLLLQLWSKV